MAVVLLGLAWVVLGVLAVANTSPGRRWLTRQVNAALASSFRGRIEIDRVGAIGMFGVAKLDGRILDPSGTPVLAVRGAGVRIATWTAMRSELFGKGGPIDIEIPSLSIDDVDVRLDQDSSGRLDLLDALSPAAPAHEDSSPRGLRLAIGRIDVVRCRAHGQMASAPYLDVEIAELTGAFTLAPGILAGDVSKARLKARALADGLDLAGSLQAHAAQSGEGLARLAVQLEWVGTIGASAHTLRASLKDGRLQVNFEMPALLPEDLAIVWPGSRLSTPARIQFEGHGQWPDVAFDLETTLGDASLRAKGLASFGDDLRASASVTGRGIDLHALVDAAPTSRLALDADVAAHRGSNGTFRGDLALHLAGGPLGTYRIPSVAVFAALSREEGQGLRGNADVVLEAPSAPTRLSVTLSPEGPSSILRFALDSSAPDFRAVPELPRGIGGSGRLRATGAVDLTHMTADAQVDASAKGVAWATTTAGNVVLTAHADGAISDPRVQLSLHSKDVAFGRFHLASVEVAAAGRVMAPHVTVRARGGDAPNVDAQTDLRFGPGLELASPRVELARSGEHAFITAARIYGLPDAIRVEGARVSGLGAPANVSVVVSGRELHGRAQCAGIDLGRLGRLVHAENDLARGKLALDAEVDVRPGSARGKATLDLADADLARLKNVAVHVETKLDGRRFSGKAHASAAGVGTLDVDAPNLELGGTGALAAASWRQAWGSLGFDARIDLAKLESMTPPDAFPLAEARGNVSVHGHLARDDTRDPTPDLGLSIVTQGLVLTPKTPMHRDIDGVWVSGPPPWRMADVDFDVDATLDGDTGALQFAAVARDRHGDLAKISTSANRFPFEDLLRGGARFLPDLRTTPFDLRVSVPERELGSLPALLKPSYLSGRLTSDLTITGTIIDPKVHWAGMVLKSRFAGTRSPWNSTQPPITMGPVAVPFSKRTAPVGSSSTPKPPSTRRPLKSSTSVVRPRGARRPGRTSRPSRSTRSSTWTTRSSPAR